MTLFVILFGVGLGFILISFFLGTVADTDTGGAMAILQPKLIAIFLTVTGGVGIILSLQIGHSMFVNNGVILLASSFLGLAVAGAIHKLIIIPLQRAQNTSAFDKQATIGVMAKIISPIPTNGYGKISYSISGSTVTSPAKSQDGGGINAGEMVHIAYIENNTYFVSRQQSN